MEHKKFISANYGFTKLYFLAVFAKSCREKRCVGLSGTAKIYDSVSGKYNCNCRTAIFNALKFNFGIVKSCRVLHY